MNKLSLTTWIVIGLLCGVFVGLLIGERAQILDPIGNGFIRLLQMAVLPYFVVALPLGFGRLSYDEARLTGVRLALFSVVLWVLGFLLVTLLPLGFPTLESASFFSSSSVEPPREVNFVELYIPANPFSSLSEAVIPGVVVFGIALGIALIGVPNKRELLVVLDSLASALARVTGFVVRLTPIGVFALAASAAGTMTLSDLSRLQVYLIAYTLGAGLLTFWLVPMLVSALTPLSYGEVMRATRDPLVTGFTTGNLLVVLPMLAENCKALLEKLDGEKKKHAESVIDVSLPIAFTFPNLGVVLLLLFVPFAGWFVGAPLELSQYPKLCAVGFFSFFGSVEIGLPFLLQQMKIPTDLFQLHVVTLVYIGRLATLLAVIHLAGVSLLCAAGNAGMLRFRPRRMSIYATTSAVLLIASIAGAAFLLDGTVDRSYSKNKLVESMQPLQYDMQGVVHRESSGETEPGEEATPLDRIRDAGVLRVGYDPQGMPFSYFNKEDELVGFDIELTEALAKELGVKTEYYPYAKEEMDSVLNAQRRYDLLVGGLFATPRRVENMRFSASYMDLHMSLIVPDHRKEAFAKLQTLNKKERLKIGVLERPYFGTKIRDLVPTAEIVTLTSPQEYFDNPDELDALVMSAEAGSAWTLLYPNYSVVLPSDAQTTIGVGFPMPMNADRFELVVSRWIDLKRKDGTIAALYDHWIEGKSAEGAGERWNIMTNVLGWNGEKPKSKLAAKTKPE